MAETYVEIVCMYTVALVRRGEGREVFLYSIQVKTAISYSDYLKGKCNVGL